MRWFLLSLILIIVPTELKDNYYYFNWEAFDQSVITVHELSPIRAKEDYE